VENTPNAGKPLEYLMDRARRMAVRYTEKGPYRLNPSRNVWEGIVRGIGRQAQTFGWPYCPCQQRTGDPEEDKKFICPCYRHKEDIAATGQCICGLFVAPDFRPEAETVTVVTPAVRPEGGAWPPITLYGASWCGHSLRVRRFFERRGIPYTYVEVEDDPDGAQRVRDWNRGYQSTPTIDIDGRILTEPSEEELSRTLGVE
jgi:ferredoxin-thioredoxin reductase catalytic subunit/glutaredoxin